MRVTPWCCCGRGAWPRRVPPRGTLYHCQEVSHPSGWARMSIGVGLTGTCQQQQPCTQKRRFLPFGTEPATNPTPHVNSAISHVIGASFGFRSRQQASITAAQRLRICSSSDIEPAKEPRRRCRSARSHRCVTFSASSHLGLVLLCVRLLLTPGVSAAAVAEAA